MATLAYSKDLKYHVKTKYTDIHFYIIQDIIAQREVILKHPTTRMMVDLLTKAIAKQIHMSS